MACHGGKLPSAANCNPMGDVFQRGFILTQDGEIMKKPSVLGLAVEQAVENDPRFKRDRESVLYGAFFRTLSGTESAESRALERTEPFGEEWACSAVWKSGAQMGNRC